ncbi:hypothetical protein [Bacillus anthracis]|uniref:hypothetical protein n=1 Tax=Bacillus anthracis TaxID=1392 RepID=UPI00227AEEC2|nr:hypothetical protein [Bacillus anthracis]MCY2907901.1 hypothetical protein [Bacillus anthracis]
MKYMHRNGVRCLTILCITACSSGERIKEISDMEPSDFKKYAGTYVGNFIQLKLQNFRKRVILK